MKSTHGGPRTPGPGKKLGRPATGAKPNRTFRLDDQEYEAVREFIKNYREARKMIQGIEIILGRGSDTVTASAIVNLTDGTKWHTGEMTVPRVQDGIDIWTDENKMDAIAIRDIETDILDIIANEYIVELSTLWELITDRVTIEA